MGVLAIPPPGRGRGVRAPLLLLAHVSGLKSELVPWLTSHMDVNAIDLTGADPGMFASLQKSAAENVKPVVRFDADAIGWDDSRLSQSPYAIYDFQETKTVWHPMGM